MPFDGNPKGFEPKPIDDPLLNVLVMAREIVERGWTQGRQYRVDVSGDRYCAVGALRVASGYDFYTYRKAVEAVECARSFLPRSFPLMDWNDLPWRRKRGVLKVFDRAITRRLQLVREKVDAA
jgi:hypothetical protein